MLNTLRTGIAIAVISMVLGGTLLLYPQFVYPQAKVEGPEFILGYKTDGEIVDVILSETEITIKEARALGIKGLEQRKETERIRVKFPSVVTIKDEEIEYETLIKSIKFLDEKGRIKKELPVRRYIPDKQSPSVVNITKNGKYVSVNNIIKEEKGSVGEAEVFIFNNNGELSQKIKHPHRNPHIAPNGNYIVGAASEPSMAPIGIYNQNGLIKEIRKDSPSWNIDFSKDGSYFAITIEAKIGGKEKYRADLLIVDENGDELWRKEDLTRGTAQNIKNGFFTAFDMTYDPAIIEFVDATEGGFLNQNGSAQTSFQVAMENGVQGKVIVGLTRLGQIGDFRRRDITDPLF